MHVEDVVGADRVCSGRLDGLVAATVQDEPERRAQARSAVELEEGEIVTPGQELDPCSGDALVADGAAMPVREREEVVQRIHPR